MGKEIIYCVKCGKRLLEDEFEEGKALKVGGKSYCKGCAPSGIEIPEPQVRIPTTRQKMTTTKRLAVQKIQQTTRTTRTEGEKSSAGLFIGIGIGVVVLIIIIVVAMGGSKNKEKEGVSPPETSQPKEEVKPPRNTAGQNNNSNQNQNNNNQNTTVPPKGDAYAEIKEYIRGHMNEVDGILAVIDTKFSSIDNQEKRAEIEDLREKYKHARELIPSIKKRSADFIARVKSCEDVEQMNDISMDRDSLLSDIKDVEGLVGALFTEQRTKIEEEYSAMKKRMEDKVAETLNDKVSAAESEMMDKNFYQVIEIAESVPVSPSPKYQKLQTLKNSAIEALKFNEWVTILDRGELKGMKVEEGKEFIKKDDRAVIVKVPEGKMCIISTDDVFEDLEIELRVKGDNPYVIVFRAGKSESKVGFPLEIRGDPKIYSNFKIEDTKSLVKVANPGTTMTQDFSKPDIAHQQNVAFSKRGKLQLVFKAGNYEVANLKIRRIKGD